MSYQVLARKWRPQIFSELVGQSHVVTALSNALTNDRLHHAYLFTGTRGVGKTTIARIFSKSLNCINGVTAEPCGECQNCASIEEGRFVDLVEVDAASRTKVEDTREILDNVQYRPSQGRYKVYLIDEVHMLSRHSFNALLKTLEEPPPHVKFLLATTDPQKLPITILSRCLQFSLKALTPEQIHAQLAHVLSAETLPFETAALDKLALAANGSMRDALSLTDQAIAQGNGQVSEQIVRSMLGMLDEQHIAQLLTALLVAADFDAVMTAIDNLSLAAVEPSQALLELINALHQVALVQVLPSYKRLNPALATLLTKLAKQLSAEQIQLYYQILLEGRKDLPFAANPRSGLEMTLLRVLSFAPVKKINPDVIISDAPEKKTELNAQPQKIEPVEQNQAVNALDNEVRSEVLAEAEPAATEPKQSDVLTTETASQSDSNLVPTSTDRLAPAQASASNTEQNIAQHIQHNTPQNTEQNTEQPIQGADVEQAEAIHAPLNTPSDLSENIADNSNTPATVAELSIADNPAASEAFESTGVAQNESTESAPLNSDVLMDVHDQIGAAFSAQFEDPGYAESHPYEPESDEYQAHSIEQAFPPSTFEPLIDDEYLNAQQAQIESLAISQGYEQVDIQQTTEQSKAAETQAESILLNEDVTAESLDIMSALQGIRAQKKNLVDKQDDASRQDFKAQPSHTQPAADEPETQNEDENALVNRQMDTKSGFESGSAASPSIEQHNPNAHQDALAHTAPNQDDHNDDVPWVDEFSGDMFAESDQTTGAVEQSADIHLNASALPPSGSLAPSNSINDLSLQEKVREGVVKSAEVDLWAQVVDSADLIGLQRQFALHSTLEHQGDSVVLSLQAEHAHLDTENNRQKITAALQQTLGQQVSLQVNIADKPQVTPFNIQTHIDVERLDYAKELIMSDANVQALQQHFNAEIDLESIKAI